MRYTAIAFNGMHREWPIPVNTVSVWIGREVEHIPTPESISALVSEAQKSGQMQIYYGDYSPGKIDAFDGTPLFTNGQESVRVLLDENGTELWRRF